MTHPMKMLSALLGGKSKKEIIAMMDDAQREMILQNMPTLHLSRVERRRMERGLRKKEKKKVAVRAIQNSNSTHLSVTAQET